LGAVFTQFPLLQQILRVVGSAYLLWLAWQLLTFSSLGKAKEGGKPFTFMQAAAFQYVNPKAWVMVISANASFTLAGESYWLSVGLIVLAYMIIGMPSISIWAGFGQYIRRFLDDPRILKVFNSGMSVLTAACVVFIWLD
jgi:threonine/homoserine/homoserine lactone efflux protein